MANTRKTVYNNIASDEKLAQINPDNMTLGNDFIEYLCSIDRAKSTIEAYKADLRVVWILILDLANNRFFVDLSKRDIVKIQNHCLNVLGWSPARMRRVKSLMSSLSNYVESMLDDEFEDYRPIVRKIENPPLCSVREKTVLEDDQLENLLEHLVDTQKYDKACMLAMAMYNGRRKSELPRMKVSYFDEENLIYGSLYKSPEPVITKGRGSRGKPLTVYTLKNGFQRYLDLWLKYREENGITSEWLIPRKKDGEWIDEQTPVSTLDSWAESFSKFLGVPFYWHSMRHYFTTACSKSGLPDDVIQMLVGWDDISMVQVYKDLSAEEQFEKYFGEEGIKQVEQKSLSDL